MSIELREPRDDDWDAVLALASLSVAHVPDAGAQDDWLANRRGCAGAGGVQQHWVAEDVESGEVVGYVSVESAKDDAGVRLFVVTDPAVREEVGAELLAHALATAEQRGATSAAFIEYADDAPFVEFLQKRGFTEARRFALDNGEEAIVMSIKLAVNAEERTSR